MNNLIANLYPFVTKPSQKPNQTLVRSVGNYLGGTRTAQQLCLKNVELGKNGKSIRLTK